MSLARWRNRLLVLGPALFAVTTTCAQPVAVVADLRGTATSATGAPVAMLEQLNAGVRLRLGAGAQATLLYFSDGVQHEVRGPGEVLIAADRPRAEGGATLSARAPAALPAMRLKPGELAQGAIVMRNLGLRVIAPEAQVMSLRPTLAWTDSRTRATYGVAVIDASGKQVLEAATSVRSLALPEQVELRPGESYAVEVRALIDGVVVQTARAEFRVAPAALREQARALAPAADALVADKVAYAWWLDQNDLRDEARNWWGALAQSRPDQLAVRNRAGLR